MSLAHQFNMLAQYAIPGHFLSRALGTVARCEIPAVKNALIRAFIKQFQINMDEVAEPDLAAYPHFNAFFTRALKAGLRPMPGDSYVACPADGTLFGAGAIDTDSRLQAKGHVFTLKELFATDEYDTLYQGGQFATVYLSPADYHRVHCPMAGELKQMTHVPGRLFSVNESTVSHIPAVFARNERVVLHFKGEHGPFSLVLVGAMLVASIETPFAGVITPPGRDVQHWNYHRGTHLKFAQGDEIGRFQYGSTVILVTPKDGYTLSAEEHLGRAVTLGQPMGSQA